MYYPINEIFQTIQGEGYYSGTPSIFIRLQGCSVHCNWCDTKYTWICDNKKRVSTKEIIKKNKISRKWSLIHVNHILKIIEKWNTKHVVITGGEPCLYDLSYLIERLENKNYQCQIETSGIKNITCSKNTWVTLSPKKNRKPLNESIIRADEIKFPILTKEDILYIYNILSNIKNKKNIIYLQPISQNQDSLNICINMCLKNNWKLSIQLHKYIKIQ